MTPHLTEAQLYDLLSAPGSVLPSARLHLNVCARCRGDLAYFEQSFANFRLAATNLALLANPPRPVVGATVSRSFFSVPQLVWATGLASVLAATAFTFSTAHRQSAAIAAHPVVAAATPTVSDEALLEDIDSDLSISVPPSLQPLVTTAAASESTSTSTSN